MFDGLVLFIQSAEFWKALGAIAVIVASIWMNPFIKSRLKDIKDDNSEKFSLLDGKIVNIETDLSSIKIALKENTEITAMTKTKQETLEVLTQVVSNALEYIGDPKLREFISVQSKSSIQFNLDLLDMGMDAITDMQIKTKMRSTQNAMVLIAKEILGEVFVENGWRASNNENVNWFIRDLLNIVHCKINYKAEAIRARTEVFVRGSIQELILEYDKFISKEKN